MMSLELFGDRKFYRDLFTLAFPIILQNLFRSLVTTLTTIMIGKLGTVEIAAAALGNQIFFMFDIFIFGICSGGSIFSAQFWGRGDVPGIRKNLGFCISLTLSVAFLYTLTTLLFPGKLISIYSRDEEVIEAGTVYLSALSFSFIPYSISLAFTLSLRSVERVRIAIVLTTIALSLNVVLNYLFILGPGPIPAMGVKGAAMATVISRIVETLILVSVTYIKKYPQAGSFRELFSFNRYYARQFFRVTLPVMIDETLWSLGVTIQNLIYARTNTDAIAAFNIASTVYNLTWVLFIGIGHGLAILIGKKIGENNEKIAREYASRSVRFTPLLSLGAALILMLLSRFLPFFFNVNTETLLFASRMLIVYSICYPFRAFNNTMIIGICRAGGDTVFGVFYELAVMWLIALPLAALTAFILKAPVMIIFICIMLEHPLKAIIGIWRFKSGKWLHNVVEKIGI